jgi:hypothetical protein
LSQVAFNFVVSSSLPKVPYNTKFDVYLLVLSSLLPCFSAIFFFFFIFSRPYGSFELQHLIICVCVSPFVYPCNHLKVCYMLITANIVSTAVLFYIWKEDRDLSARTLSISISFWLYFVCG